MPKIKVIGQTVQTGERPHPRTNCYAVDKNETFKLLWRNHRRSITDIGACSMLIITNKTHPTKCTILSGRISNNHLIAYSPSNISAKNYQNRLMCVEVIVYYISVVFFETQCTASEWYWTATACSHNTDKSKPWTVSDVSLLVLDSECMLLCVLL